MLRLEPEPFRLKSQALIHSANLVALQKKILPSNALRKVCPKLARLLNTQSYGAKTG